MKLSRKNVNQDKPIIKYGGKVEFGHGHLFLDKKTLVEYPTTTLLISLKEINSFQDCQIIFHEIENSINEGAGKREGKGKIARLFVDKSGFYIYLENQEEYIHFRSAFHVQKQRKTLQIVTENNGIFCGILIWLCDDLNFQFFDAHLYNNFYREIYFRLSLRGKQDHSKNNCDIFEYPPNHNSIKVGFSSGIIGKQNQQQQLKEKKNYQHKSQTEYGQSNQNNLLNHNLRQSRQFPNSPFRSLRKPSVLSKETNNRPLSTFNNYYKGYEPVQSNTKEQRASTSNSIKYEVINHPQQKQNYKNNLVLNIKKPGDSTSAGVVLSARRAPSEITTASSSYNRNVAGCSAGPEQIISTLKDCKIGASSIEEEIIPSSKHNKATSSSSNGASDPLNEAAVAGHSEIPESDIESALGNKAEVDKFLEFLNQQYCSENLYFYLSVQEYKALQENDQKGRTDLGNQIFGRHFAQNCHEPVNIEYATNKAIQEAKKQNNWQIDTYDHAQYQIFHLLKYDVWPRYIRAEMEKRAARGENDVASENTETSSCGGESSRYAKRPSVREYRYCMVLSADSVSSEKEVLDDPLISVKRWTETMAQRRGMDKNSTEVVDAQTGSTIDPARQAIDALNNRHVRLMPVVRFPVDFLAPSASSKNSSPMPAKVVMLRVRQGLTLMKVLRPLLIKYNFDPNDIVTCFSGTCDPIHLSTTVACITPRMVTVMTQQQFKDRKLLPKKEYQKELCASPILAQNQEMNFPYFQHGDIAFYELPTEADSKGQKHSAIRSHSTNPRFQELFKFGRKASQAKSKSDNEGNIAGSGGGGGGGEVLLTSGKPIGGSDRRKSIGGGRTAGGGPTPSSVAPSDIPYCGEATSTQDDSLLNIRVSSSPKLRKDPSSKQQPQQSLLSKECGHKPNPVVAKATSFEGQCVVPKGCFEMPDFLKESYNAHDIKIIGKSGGLNGNAPRVPAIYASAVRSEKEAISPSDMGVEKISWYADYV